MKALIARIKQIARRKPGKGAGAPENRITWRAFIAGLIFAATWTVMTVLWENAPKKVILTATQIPVMPYVLLFASVLLINPVLKLVRIIRPFSPAEILLIFIMGVVSSGISTFGLASQLVPIISGLMNKHWNNEQNQWELYIEPYVNEKFFVAETGVRQAAVAYRDADEKWGDARDMLRAANNLKSSKQHQKTVAAKLEEVRQIQDPVKRAMAVKSVEQEKDFAAQGLEQAQKRWDKLTARHPDKSIEEVIKTHPKMVDQFEAQKNTLKEALEAKEAKGFAIIDEFCDGFKLSKNQKRAPPGFVYIKGEGLTAYFGRSRRRSVGGKALGEIEKAAKLLARARESGGPAIPLRVAALEHTQSATDILEKIATNAKIEKRQKKVEKELTELDDKLQGERKKLKILHHRRREGPAEEFDKLDAKVKKVDKYIAKLSKRYAEFKLEEEQNQRELGIIAGVAQTRDGLIAFQEKLKNAPVADYPALQTELAQLEESFDSFDATWKRYLVGDVPWGHWLRPLLNWTVLIMLTYLILMAFNVLIFRQWAHNEKLIYPLAELPMALVGAGSDESPGLFPTPIKRGLFWAGVAISALLLGWNLLAVNKIIPDVQPIKLFQWGVMWNEWIQGSFLSGLWDTGRFHVFFTLVGLSFLVPAKISGSLWGFHLLYYLQLLILVWLNRGVNIHSFTPDWLVVLNFRTATGGGALLVFSSVILWKCRKYFFCIFAPKSLAGLPLDEQKELRVHSGLFIGGSLALIATLTWGLGVNFFYSIMLFFIILVITIGLVRAVTEGGILSFQCWFGPMHLGRTIFGMKKWFTAPSFFAPILVFYSIIFLDIKTFIAPAMANALKIRDDLRMRRLHFHLSVWAAIICTFFLAIVVHIIMAYHQGANQMHGWFYQSLPQTIFGQIRNMAKTSPVDTAGGLNWLIFGGVAMILLLYFRRHVFWLPHPIGLIMMVNPMMNAYWFSIFLGWVCKVLVTKYGNKKTYLSIRYLFIGLIVGEVIMCLFGHTLNRN